MRNFTFELGELPPEAEVLREEVREFLRVELPKHQAARSWEGGFDREFSRKMGERGWIGMTWPKPYGGHERSAFERYVVVEEMLVARAPQGAHRTGDRQSGPVILRVGNEEQKQFFLPRIARGELAFCIGMSEPDAGSDLASVRTRAERSDGGWSITGRKVWTSNAHRSDWMIALVRTQPLGENKHAGLSQFLVDMTSPGLTIRPIIDLAGGHHFNEITFEDVFVPRERLLGDEGAGWNQVSAELSYERSGPERYLSSLQLVVELIAALPEEPGPREAIALGRMVAHLNTLRQMSLSVAGMLQARKDPGLEAALVKDLGTTFEQEIPEIVQGLLELEPRGRGGEALEAVFAHLTMYAPSFSLRGGTREILRGIIARGLGLR